MRRNHLLLPLSRNPGVVNVAPDGSLTAEQRNVVFGNDREPFMRHLAALLTTAAAARRSPTSPAGERLSRPQMSERYSDNTTQAVETVKAS